MRKKPFQFWREIWIQVVVIILQLYIQRLCCPQVQIWYKKWTGNCVSREPFWYSTMRHLRNDAGFNAEFWEIVELPNFQNGFEVLGCLARLKYPTINKLPFPCICTSWRFWENEISLLWYGLKGKIVYKKEISNNFAFAFLTKHFPSVNKHNILHFHVHLQLEGVYSLLWLCVVNLTALRTLM